MKPILTFTLLVLAVAFLAFTVKSAGTNGSATIVGNMDDAAIDSAMEHLGDALKLGDLSYQYQIMFTPVLDTMGGKTQVLEMLKPYIDQFKRLPRVTVVSWEVHKPYQYVSGKTHKFAVIPYESVTIIGEKMLKKKSYEFGIKHKDSEWQFVCGDNLSPEIFEEIFPDFPGDVQVPKVERVFEKHEGIGVGQVLATYKIGGTTFEQFKKDTQLIMRDFSEMPGMPPSIRSNMPEMYLAEPTSNWRIYSFNKKSYWSFGKSVDEKIFEVGDSGHAISNLTFSNGILSKMEPVK